MESKAQSLSSGSVWSGRGDRQVNTQLEEKMIRAAVWVSAGSLRAHMRGTVLHLKGVETSQGKFPGKVIS